MLNNRLDFIGARGEDSMGSLSRSLFEISFLGTDCLVAEGDLVSGGVGGFRRATIRNCDSSV